jgi:cation:H+ antiporter
LIVVGFATAFELVVLAWSAARRGVSEAVAAGVIGSFAYNVTMSLGAGAVARPLRIAHPGQLHGPWLAMGGALLAALLLAFPRRQLGRTAGWLLLAAYPIVAVTVLAR